MWFLPFVRPLSLPKVTAAGSLGSLRSFSTSFATNRLYAHVTRRKVAKVEPLQKGDPETFLPEVPPEFPPYPYGDATLYKQSNRGLYGGRMIMFGNKISEFKNHNRRTFKPNVNRQTLWSEALNRKITIRVHTSVLRSITKEGGLDNYLIKDTSARIKQLGPMGWKLRYLVLCALRDQSNKAKKEAFANPKPVGTTQSGKPIYVNFEAGNGNTYPITATRSELLEALAKLNAKHDVVNVERTVKKNEGVSIVGILHKLEERGFDFGSVSEV